MRKAISPILLGITAAGLLAGCVGVSESDPVEKKTIQTAAKPKKTVLQERLKEAIRKNDLESVKKLVIQGADITYVDLFEKNALHYAASSHSLEIFQWLLDQGADIHATDKDGNNVLHLLFDGSGAGYYGKNMDTGECYCCHETKSKPETILKMVKYLTERKVNLNAKNKHGMTPVRLAVCFGYLEIVKYLAEHGAELNDTLDLATLTGQCDMVKYLVEHGADVNEFAGFPLMHASGKAVVQYLVEHGAKVNIQDEYGRFPLHWHVERNNLETIKYLVNSGADIYCRDKAGSSVIHWAANNGRVQNADFFLELGLDINGRNNDGMTPLHFACKLYDWSKEKMAMIRYLVEHGADVNAHSFSQERARTPLHIAILQYDDGRAAEYLLKHGAKVDEIDSRGQTALHYASKWNCYEGSRRLNAIKLLVSWNANVNAEDSAGMTPLHYAVGNAEELAGMTPFHYSVGNLECVKYLVEHGANVNAKNTHKGRTPLHVAVLTTADDKVLTYLLDHHAEINRQDDDGKTPLHYALCCLNMKAAKFLVEHGADVNLRDKEGKTPLDLAEAGKLYETAKYLKAHSVTCGKSLNDNNKQ